MISRLWQTVNSWIGLTQENKPTFISKHEKKQRFFIINDPYVPQKTTKPKPSPPKPQQTFPQSAQEVMNMYSICLQKSGAQIQEQKIAVENSEFILDLKSLDKALKEIELKSNEILNESSSATHEITTILDKIKSINSSEKQERENFRKYTFFILEVADIKYKGEQINFPIICFEKFKLVLQAWSMNEKKAQVLVQGYDHLRYSHLKLLAPSLWLNDEVISEYIGHMNGKLMAKAGNTYSIFNSLKVKSLFEKTDYEKVKKILERQKVTTNSTLILAVHKYNHWIFLKMENSSIEIYDSMLLSNTQSYLQFALIRKIVQFSEKYYGRRPVVERVLNFPQQKNGYDCGMMMLCGIKDLVRNYNQWSFSQCDICYKRALVTHQLLENRLFSWE